MRTYFQRPEVRERDMARERSAERKAYYQKNKEFIAAKSKAYRQENKERVSNKKKEAYVRHRRANLIRAAKHRASLASLPFEIKVTDLAWPELCPVFGLRMNYETSKRSELSPSLDRLVASRGYVKGNVAVISMRANRLKNSATADELRQLVRYVTKYLG